MHIEWNRVTWYSKVVAVVVFLVTAALFFWIGMVYGGAKTAVELAPHVNVGNVQGLRP